jgi:hypothetical protein
MLTTKRILQFLAGFLVGYLAYIGFSSLMAELTLQAAIRRLPILIEIVTIDKQETDEPELKKADTIQ